MGQHNNKKYTNMRLEQELQARMNDICKIAEMLVDNEMANWQIFELPNGQRVVALVLPERLWKFQNGRIIFGKG